jgi:hypothetical protein
MNDLIEVLELEHAPSEKYPWKLAVLPTNLS